jgi:hypothetical protein
MRGFRVIIVGGRRFGDNTYAEQFVAWQLANAPVISRR